MSDRILKLFEKMTLAEKVGQLNQHLYGFDSYRILDGGEIAPAEGFVSEVEKWGGLGFLYGLHRSDPWSAKNFENGLGSVRATKAYNALQRYVLEHSRLEIPMAVTSECPHGNQILDGYLYPVNLAVGATFNPEIFEKATGKAGKQLRELGVQLALMSLLDVCRDPRWGRSEECFSEDSYLASRFAEAGVIGMQREGIGCVAKHLAGQGQTTGGVNASSALIGWNELKEIHLKTMEACAKAGAEAVMAAYNDIDGVPCHGNSRLLKDYLRDEISFDGLIMADGLAIDRLDVITGDNERSAALALESGVEVSLWDEGFTKLEKVVSGNSELMECLDKAVVRVLEFKEKKGLFDKPFIDESNKYVQLGSYEGEDDPSYGLSLESPVLLKNDGEVLPLNNIEDVAVAGDAADDIYRQLGDYTPYIKRENAYTVFRGVEEATGKAPEYYESGADFASMSKQSAIICVLGGSSSRFAGASFDKNGAAIETKKSAMDCGEGVDSANLQIAAIDLEMLRKLRKENPKARIVTVVIAGRAYIMDEVLENSDAVLFCFYPGPMGGKAIAEIIFGKRAPSGLLPVSIPRSAAQLPCYYNYRASYDGMKYTDMESGARFSFGYGLCYGQFEYGDLAMEDGKIKLTMAYHGDFKECLNTIMLFGRRRNGKTVPRVKELLDFKKMSCNIDEKVYIEFDIPKDFSGTLMVFDGRGQIGEVSI